MTRRPLLTLLAPLSVAAGACATIRGSGVDREDTTLPDHLARIPIYWQGTLPECGVQALQSVTAFSRADLRRLAYEAGGNAVVDARMGSRASSALVSRNRPPVTTVSYVYSGMAARLPSKCHK